MKNKTNNKLNELVERLTKEQGIECSRPEKTALALKECIDRNYIHVMFKETGTEIGMQLYPEDCNVENASFEDSSGLIQLVGALTLNYNKVKCTVEVDLSNCEGKGCLIPINDDEYEKIMGLAVE